MIHEKKKGDVGTEEMVIEAIMTLICHYDVINTEKQLNVLISKFGVDWVSIVDKVGFAFLLEFLLMLCRHYVFVMNIN